jgi:hypothetical protein
MPAHHKISASFWRATACSVLLFVSFADVVQADAVGCEWLDVLTEYDTNGDGRLDSKEREVLRKSRPMEFTCDPGRGTWDRKAHEQRSRESEGGGASSKPPPHPLAQFDKNENGVFDPSEVAAAREAVAKKSTKSAGKKAKSG